MGNLNNLAQLINQQLGSNIPIRQSFFQMNTSQGSQLFGAGLAGTGRPSAARDSSTKKNSMGIPLAPLKESEKTDQGAGNLIPMVLTL